MVAIYHYFKWVETKVVDYDMKIIATFFENEIIYQFRVLKKLLTYNGGEWVVEFDQLCKNYEIIHQYIALQRPSCNGMAKGLIKTLKHGSIILFMNVKTCSRLGEPFANNFI